MHIHRELHMLTCGSVLCFPAVVPCISYARYTATHMYVHVRQVGVTSDMG